VIQAVRLFAFLVTIPLLAGCPSAPADVATNPPPRVDGRPVDQWGYKVVKEYPHDPLSFCQGLICYEGGFLESAGQYGQSNVRRVKLKDGTVTKRANLEDKYFAEGTTLLNGVLYQITWQEGTCFTYDPKTLKRTGKITYEGEGWGLTHDGKSLILSDGTNKIKFMDPKTMKVQRVISVFIDNDPRMPQYDLNELEMVEGEIFANIWHADVIYRIDPKDGRLLGVIDMSGLPVETRGDPDRVLNGIAYDSEAKRLFVTGKYWPKLFEIKLEKKK
jgi:glutaminyl-peptide cyclotransferase